MLNQKSHPWLHLIFACLFFISIIVQASPQQPFIEIAAHPAGELILLPSPDNTIIKDMPILAFRGLPAFGRHKLKLTSAFYSQQELNYLNLNAARIHSDLMRMKLASTKPNIERLKKKFKGGMGIIQGPAYDADHPEQAVEDRDWYKLITRLAAASLTDQAYAQYMCKENPCSKFDLNGQKNGSTSGWGGLLANQFESRRAFASFIDTELDKYLAWSKQLHAEPEVYFVGQTRLSSYIFDKGGFVIRLKRVSGGGLPTTGENLKNHPIFTAKIENPNMMGVLVKVNEVEAEKIVERMQGKQLFYVYKAKLSVADQSYNQQTKQLDFNRLLLDQTITSDVIEVFIGPELQDKLFDIPL